MTSLNQEEKDLLESVENEKWVSVDNLSREKQRFESYAQQQVSTEKIEVILSTADKQQIQQLAASLNLPVPHLLQEIVHKYLQRNLVERMNRL